MTIFTAHPDVTKFMRNLDDESKARLARISTAVAHGPEFARMPHSRPIGRGLFEMRIKGANEIRIIYAYRGDKVLLLHGFVKKSRKLAGKELRLAHQRLDTFDRLSL